MHNPETAKSSDKLEIMAESLLFTTRFAFWRLEKADFQAKTPYMVSTAALWRQSPGLAISATICCVKHQGQAIAWP